MAPWIQRLARAWPWWALGGAAALLAAVAARVAWKELPFSRAHPPAVSLEPEPVSTNVPAAWPGIETVAVQESRPVPANPFHSAHIEKYLARLAAEKAAAEEAARRKAAEEEARRKAEDEARRKAEEDARRAAAAASPSPAPTPEAPPPSAPPGPVILRFVYRGMLQRTDGARLALVESGPPPSVRFYQAGERCLGLMVTNVASRDVGLVLPGGTVQALGVGAAFTVPEAEVRAGGGGP
jgi:hypothetical protein